MIRYYFCKNERLRLFLRAKAPEYKEIWRNMNYIVLDLEWNQAAYKADEEWKIPFEIIEIGAVKLDENCQIIETFQRLIRP